MLKDLKDGQGMEVLPDELLDLVAGGVMNNNWQNRLSGLRQMGLKYETVINGLNLLVDTETPGSGSEAGYSEVLQFVKDNWDQFPT